MSRSLCPAIIESTATVYQNVSSQENGWLSDFVIKARQEPYLSAVYIIQSTLKCKDLRDTRMS